MNFVEETAVDFDAARNVIEQKLNQGEQFSWKIVFPRLDSDTHEERERERERERVREFTF